MTEQRPSERSIFEAAIEKIEDGVFGECEDCGGQISKARLNAIPYAALCIKCAQKMERS